MDPIGNSPDEFAATIKRDIAKWAKRITDAGIKVEQDARKRPSKSSLKSRNVPFVLSVAKRIEI